MTNKGNFKEKKADVNQTSDINTQEKNPSDITSGINEILIVNNNINVSSFKACSQNIFNDSKNIFKKDEIYKLNKRCEVGDKLLYRLRALLFIIFILTTVKIILIRYMMNVIQVFHHIDHIHTLQYSHF